MLVATIIGSIIQKVGALIITQFSIPISFETLNYLLFAVALYAKYKIIMGLFRRYPRDYDQHVIAIWIFAITPLLAYYAYFSFYFADIVNLIIPESALAISVTANAIFAFLVSRALYQEAEDKNQEMRKKIQFDSFQESEMAQQSALQSNSNQKLDSENSLKANPTLPIELHGSTKTKHARAIQENLIDDEKFYKAALEEFEQDEKVSETWAKAISLSEGDIQKGKWKYVELRVQYLTNEERRRAHESKIVVDRMVTDLKRRNEVHHEKFKSKNSSIENVESLQIETLNLARKSTGSVFKEAFYNAFATALVIVSLLVGLIIFGAIISQSK